MHKYFMRPCMLFVVLIFPQLVIADTYQQGVEVQCNMDGLTIRGFDLENGKPLKKPMADSQLYLDNETHKVECGVKYRKVIADFYIPPQSGRGECGALPGASLSLSINGKALLERASMSNGCTTTLDEIRVERGARENDVQLVLCGHSNHRNIGRYNGCVFIDDSGFKRISKALNGATPITDLLRAF